MTSRNSRCNKSRPSTDCSSNITDPDVDDDVTLEKDRERERERQREKDREREREREGEREREREREREKEREVVYLSTKLQKYLVAKTLTLSSSCLGSSFSLSPASYILFCLIKGEESRRTSFA